MEKPSSANLEIACDESGWEGSNLAAANSDVIAHASVRLDPADAARWVRVLRGQAGQQGIEFKAGNLWRANGGAGLAGFLGPAGPVHGKARVHLTHKSCFVLGRVLDLFAGKSADKATFGLRPDPRLEGLAGELCRRGPATFGPQRWHRFLMAANSVLQVRHRPRVHEPVDTFLAQAELFLAERSGLTQALGELRLDRQQGYALRAQLIDDHVLHPVLEPLLPAVARTVLHWSQGRTPVTIVHDEQSALTEKRIQRLEAILAAPPLELIRPPAQGRFVRLRQADSRADPRVQVADLLAGVSRRLASENLAGQGDPALFESLGPYLDQGSRWCGRRP